MKLTTAKVATALGVAALGIGGVSTAEATSTTSSHQISFNLQRSAASIAADCLTNARATVKVVHKGQVEEMTINATGLPKNTEFDTFVTQLPNSPFGISWYQGDLESDSQGKAHVKYVGRFSLETFAIAPGVGPAPSVHNGPFPDAAANPQFAPVHTYHVGVWFNSSQDAAAAGCTNVVTAFNGDHNAGPQALSTTQFGDTTGPLRNLVP